MNNAATAYEVPEIMEKAPGGVVAVAVDLLVADETLRLNGVNEGHVKVVAQLDSLPPILVHRGSMRVIDGMHRLSAAKLRGWTTINVRFFDGDVEAAFVEAVRVNSAHGLPLTLADRKAAATRIVRMHPEWSDRRIAELVGLSPKTVGAVRGRLTEEFPQSMPRIGRDGRVRRLPTRPVACEISPAPACGASDAGAPASPDEPARVTPLPAKKTHRGRPVPTPREEPDIERCRKTLSALSQDPSLRMTETGRFLLQLLSLHLARGREWEQLLSTVPAHRADLVANLASECARMWVDFARKIVP
ncbi:ParB/RepB/Spo0J family partition protein [Streptomyces sp. GQFP]|uniref:ParB/RepB/Spo0J family partition protein n=1 Tax=Streptomyces sp. GQFP TaxID=2907545 RepID=UPI001F327A8B|nr:ParB/RepB/Spo0J family partition protein [Streptomyces sp. GQFP]UIX32077.1 ParB/RepB/Spo0J family partition protein [Streptomyces sp. GQFP]